MVKVDLSNYNEIFADAEIKDLKNKNFFYGKNGTGKSTLCHIMYSQLIGEYDVRVFQGFESVLNEDERLNSIVLGEENNRIQTLIDEELDRIEQKNNVLSAKENVLKGLYGDEGVSKNNYLVQYEKMETKFNNKSDEIGLLCQDAAGELTNQFNFGRRYNRNHFRSDISKAQKLSQLEYENFFKISQEKKKVRAKKKNYPNIDLNAYLKSVNEIIESKVDEVIIIPELQSNKKKRKFAEEGLNLHETGDKCAFCGGNVTEKRFEELRSVFDTEEVYKLQGRIKNGIDKINQTLNIIKKIELLKEGEFYSHFEVSSLNSEISISKEDHLDFLEGLKSKLIDKEKLLFEKMDSCMFELPTSFAIIQEKINKVVEENNEFGENIEKNIDEANKNLKLHFVAIKCEEKGYERLIGELKAIEKMKVETKEILDGEIQKVTIQKKDIESELKLYQDRLKELQSKIKNPEIIIDGINEKILKSGKQNLKLKYIEEGKHYKILNRDGSTRDVKEISTGEKNIISFLYFIGSLESPDLDNGKPKIIILDDPMNSNDDTMQYLIISEIEKLYNKKNLYEHFILLTHNSHFYLKATFGRRERRDGKNAYEIDNFVRMLNDGNITSFKYLSDKKEDFVTQYGSLWKELKFLYENDKKDFMCNTIRRIIETYTVFNGVPGNKNAESKMLFNTNSHFSEVGDLETDTNGYTREQIIELLKQYFKQNNAEKHFNNYWK